MLPSEEEGLQNQTSTFVCLARDFAPQSHKFHWVYNGNYLPGESSGEQKGSDGNYTASSYLVVSHASWASAGAVRCEFEHKSGNLTKEAWQGEENNRCIMDYSLCVVLCGFIFNQLDSADQNIRERD